MRCRITGLLLLLAICACSPSGASSPPRSSAIPVGSSTHSITVGGTARTFRIYRPASLPASAPLVVVLHGALGSGQQAERSYGWDAQADAGHFLVAYPDGLHRTWDVTPQCCGPAAAQQVDDIGFITALVRSISAALPVDPARIDVAGISNGGLLAYALACRTTVFAAIGGVSTTELGACADPAPASVLHIHGTADHTIPYAGGPGQRDNGGTGDRPVGIDGPPIPELNQRWRAIDHCAPPGSSRSGPVTISAATCPQGRSVELITIAGAGHQWPGQPGPQAGGALHLDPPYAGLDGTATLWSFFQSYPKEK